MSRPNAFRFLCSLLDPGGSERTRTVLKSCLHARRFTWEELVIVASEQRVSSIINAAIHMYGLAEDLPQDLLDYFSGMEELGNIRNDRVRDQALEIGKALNNIGVAPILLKGAASLLTSLYSSPAHRVMQDIDLLVSHDKVLDCVAQLKRLGYSEDAHDIVADPKLHNYPALFRAGDECEVEIHSEIIAFPHGDFLSPDEVIASAKPFETDGVSFYVPCDEHLVLHSIHHCHIADKTYKHGFFLLRQAHELVLIHNAAKLPIDWQQIEERFRLHNRSTAYASQILSMKLISCINLPDAKYGTAAARRFHQWAWVMLNFPRAATWISKLLQPLALLRRSLMDDQLRVRLLQNVRKREWLARHLRLLVKR